MTPEPTFAVLKCKTSVSPIPNNLSVYKNSILYAHRNEVYISQDSRSDITVNDRCEQFLKGAYNEKDLITTVGYYKVSAYCDEPVIIVANSCGYIGIYDHTGEVLLNSHKLMKSQVALSSKDAYIRAVATNSVDKLYAGTGNGEIMVFTLANKKMALLQKINASTKAIHSVWYDIPSKSLAVGDENGTLSVFVNDATTPTWTQRDLRTVDSTNANDYAPISVINSKSGYIITGTTTGKLRYYSISKQELSLEISAHARPISSLDTHPTLPLVIAGSEDTYISLWNVPTAEAPTIRNLGLFSPATQIVTGVKFANSVTKVPDDSKTSTTVMCTIYDSRSVFCAPVSLSLP